LHIFLEDRLPRIISVLHIKWRYCRLHLRSSRVLRVVIDCRKLKVTTLGCPPRHNVHVLFHENRVISPIKTLKSRHTDSIVIS